ncbi:MAG: aryl-alcohol dehydrogenase-like predicted oxidoreductase [Flavobacteriales bacterium]|jgi:aryl-alcohol dehydrogenase-like predicted oxidoreductase
MRVIIARIYVCSIATLMKMKKLGRTGLDVSLIGLGTMTWGEQNTPQEAFKQMDLARDYGINFFDTAEMYPVPPKPDTQGASEGILGDWLKARGSRDDIVLASKVTGRGDRNRGLEHIRDSARLSAAHIQQAVEESLQRLKTDYIDLYQVHWPERSTNFFGRLDYKHIEEPCIEIEETLEALAELVKVGKVRHIGISNESAWGAFEYLRLANENGFPRIASIQNPYNLLNRSFDVGLSEIAIREDLPLLAYSPLAFGVLTGKYLGGAKPEGARLTLYNRFSRYFNPQAEAATQAYVDIAHKFSIDPAQMALAWVNAQPHVASNIIGATTIEQLKSNIESIELHLNDAVLAEIDSVHTLYSNPAP